MDILEKGMARRDRMLFERKIEVLKKEPEFMKLAVQ